MPLFINDTHTGFPFLSVLSPFVSLELPKQIALMKYNSFK